MSDGDIVRTSVTRAPSRSRGPRGQTAAPATFGVLLKVLAPGFDRQRFGAWAGAVLLLGIAWGSPVSPGSLQWADVALGLGRPEVAAAHYDRIARWSPFRAYQRQALLRGAMVASVELGDPVEARRQLQWLARISRDPVEIADVKERIATLLLEERNPTDAARLLRESHDACPACPEAARRLVRSAELLGGHGETDRALETFEEVVRLYPAHRARANIGRGEILLARGDSLDALEMFDDAAATTFDADLQAVAKLGSATCLERLGNLDGALAELDAADLPPLVRASRKDGMRARLADE